MPVAIAIREYDELKRKLEGERKSSDTLKQGARLPQCSEREGWTQEKTAEGRGGTGVERTVVRNEPLPPTPKAGDRYRLSDPTDPKPVYVNWA